MRLPLAAFLLLILPCLAHAGPGEIRVTSADFAEGASIPARFTCQGQNISPSLAFADVPASAKSLVLIVDDPDAPSGTFTHWLVWNIPPGTKKLPSGASPPGAPQGTNDFGSVGYSGPCPPSGVHRYLFHLYALNTLLHLPSGASRTDLDAAIRGHVMATAVLEGHYTRSSSQ
jgi:Raf kinase inhibitor-like YbhB/YbcL family protein